MDAEMFNELLESVRQGKDILKGERTASRRFYVNEINVSQLRSRFELTQNKFAQMLGISVSTLRNWEQGRRKPEGPARVLLQIADLHPEAVLETTNS
ncbi:MAG: helix-turn-helix domain-containing protein [SAR324 cluster bacterium]|jgi:putative transcriptional regulator|nr:helix-turn-helix domain-containing protein [SAR324 cluster bacterium]MCH2266431.1 helix-turn-helix domain-containing protein [SAR324 cluster bacterium]|tara:strand:+ start:145 stop:435 length:291 start_codon:yes stop_codon:yes gene_type:complete